MKKLEFSININAPKEKVWEALWKDENYRKWTAVFSEGSYAESDFEKGSEFRFLNPEKDGVWGEITEMIPNEKVYFTHRGEVHKGINQPKTYGETFTYMITVVAVIALELLIRFSGGSGSISGLSPYADEKFFGVILIAHIIGAVLTYILWTYLLLQSRRKFDTDLPGNFSKTHKILAKVVIVGLIYTAVSALIVYLLTLGLI